MCGCLNVPFHLREKLERAENLKLKIHFEKLLYVIRKGLPMYSRCPRDPLTKSRDGTSWGFSRHVPTSPGTKNIKRNLFSILQFLNHNELNGYIHNTHMTVAYESASSSICYCRDKTAVAEIQPNPARPVIADPRTSYGCNRANAIMILMVLSIKMPKVKVNFDNSELAALYRQTRFDGTFKNFKITESHNLEILL